MLLLAGEGKDMLSVRVLHMYLNVQEFCLSSVCTHIPPTGKIPNLYISMQKKSIQKAKTGVKIPSLQLIKLLKGFVCTHSTTGFGIEINLIWIQSDSLLHSVRFEEWGSVAAIDLQSERDSHQTDAPSRSAGS